MHKKQCRLHKKKCIFLGGLIVSVLGPGGRGFGRMSLSAMPPIELHRIAGEKAAHDGADWNVSVRRRRCT